MGELRDALKDHITNAKVFSNEAHPDTAVRAPQLVQQKKSSDKIPPSYRIPDRMSYSPNPQDPHPTSEH